MIAASFAPWRVRLRRVRSSSTQLAIKCLKFIFLLLRKKDNIVRKTKQHNTKHVYFSFSNPLKVTGELEIESLG